jgi:hypothetical protein
MGKNFSARGFFVHFFLCVCERARVRAWVGVVCRQVSVLQNILLKQASLLVAYCANGLKHSMDWDTCMFPM